eukprot:1084359-Amphidinium_carterae.1
MVDSRTRDTEKGVANPILGSALPDGPSEERKNELGMMETATRNTGRGVANPILVARFRTVTPRNGGKVAVDFDVDAAVADYNYTAVQNEIEESTLPALPGPEWFPG